MLMVANWTFLTNRARVLLCIAHDPGVRLRDIAVSLGITERRAYGVVTDLAKAGYVVKQKDGRRNRYQIQAHLPLARRTQRRLGHASNTLLPKGRAGPWPDRGPGNPEHSARHEHSGDTAPSAVGGGWSRGVRELPGFLVEASTVLVSVLSISIILVHFDTITVWL